MADGIPTLYVGFFQGIRTSIAKEPYRFVILQAGGEGEGPDSLSPPLDPHMIFIF